MSLSPLSADQESLLKRTLHRLRQMHTTISPVALALSLRTNDMPADLDLVRKWLEQNENAPETTKPESIPAPGVDLNGVEKDMANGLNRRERGSEKV